MTENITYGQICEERKRCYDARNQMLERWKAAGWEINWDNETVRIPNKQPPYEEDECP